MSWSANSDWKCCATCANWAGPRTVKFGRTSEIESPSIRGKCGANVFCGVTQGPIGSSGHDCAKYQKWGSLK